MIGIVHLVGGIGPAALREFLRTNREHPPGVEHELCIVFNGVTASDRPAVLAELEHTPHRAVELPERLQDIAAYAVAAERLGHDELVFTNSYVTPLINGWVAKLAAALESSGCGLVGATASWGSFHSTALNSLHLPNPYRRAMPERQASLAADDAMRVELAARRAGDPQPARAPAQPRRSLAARVIATLRSLPPMPEQLLRYEPFPAHHVRSNAFIMPRAAFLELRIGAIKRKQDAFYVESGRGSITRQVQARGLRTLVVDRNGDTYDQAQWPDSLTFWQGNQERLLVADNQTDVYANGDIDRRRLLSAFAWGPLAQPSAPQPLPSPT